MAPPRLSTGKNWTVLCAAPLSNYSSTSCNCWRFPAACRCHGIQKNEKFLTRHRARAPNGMTASIVQRGRSVFSIPTGYRLSGFVASAFAVPGTRGRIARDHRVSTVAETDRTTRVPCDDRLFRTDSIWRQEKNGFLKKCTTNVHDGFFNGHAATKSVGIDVTAKLFRTILPDVQWFLVGIIIKDSCAPRKKKHFSANNVIYVTLVSLITTMV